MRRSVEEAFAALHAHVRSWKTRAVKSHISVFVYPPEWEAAVLARFPAFGEQCEGEGTPIELVDVGQGLLTEVERRDDLEEALAHLEPDDPDGLIHDLGIVTSRYLKRAIGRESNGLVVGRVLVNTGALATFVSYSALANELAGAGDKAGEVPVPCVLAFPGEGDERFLNLVGRRADTNYRTPRI